MLRARDRIKETANRQTCPLSEATQKIVGYFTNDLPNKNEDLKRESQVYVRYLDRLYRKEFQQRKNYIFKVP